MNVFASGSGASATKKHLASCPYRRLNRERRSAIIADSETSDDDLTILRMLVCAKRFALHQLQPQLARAATATGRRPMRVQLLPQLRDGARVLRLVREVLVLVCACVRRRVS